MRAQLADGLVDFFQDFNEHEVEEEAPPSQPIASSGSPSGPTEPEEPEMLAMLRDAVNPERSPNEAVLDQACLSDETSETFVQGVERAIDHMLKKHTQSMQGGLEELADVSDKLFVTMEGLNFGCVSRGVESMRLGARKLRTLTRKTFVEYGTVIEYEALKKLVVGSVDIHLEINAFISAWKLRSHKESGAPFGKLLRKLVEIKGHDEL